MFFLQLVEIVEVEQIWLVVIGYGIACYFSLVFIFLSFESLNRFSCLNWTWTWIDFQQIFNSSNLQPHIEIWTWIVPTHLLSYLHVYNDERVKFQIQQTYPSFHIIILPKQKFQEQVDLFQHHWSNKLLDICYTKKACCTTQFHLDFPCVEVMTRQLLDPNIKRW